MDIIRETHYEGVNWILLAKDGVLWQALMNYGNDLQVP
jgi:hypothetical protein